MFRFALPQSSAQCCERADSVRLPAAFAAAERRDYNLSRIFAFAIQPNPMCGGSENMQTPYENFALILYMQNFHRAFACSPSRRTSDSVVSQKQKSLKGCNRGVPPQQRRRGAAPNRPFRSTVRLIVAGQSGT